MSLSSKEWWNKVNTISGNTTKADDPVLKNQDQVYTTAKEKAELLSQTLANQCQMEDAYDPAPDVHNSTQHTTNKITFKFKDVFSVNNFLLQLFHQICTVLLLTLNILC